MFTHSVFIFCVYKNYRAKLRTGVSVTHTHTHTHTLLHLKELTESVLWGSILNFYSEKFIIIHVLLAKWGHTCHECKVTRWMCKGAPCTYRVSVVTSVWLLQRYHLHSLFQNILLRLLLFQNILLRNIHYSRTFSYVTFTVPEHFPT